MSENSEDLAIGEVVVVGGVLLIELSQKLKSLHDVAELLLFAGFVQSAERLAGDTSPFICLHNLTDAFIVTFPEALNALNKPVIFALRLSCDFLFAVAYVLICGLFALCHYDQSLNGDHGF